ncbi:MAG: hypothetical protein DHS20C02_06400 [Micavibrio sp.]|nr:MAG: hypothetical protein DHS20C02_06400 [Micavibrio sp.]
MSILAKQAPPTAKPEENPPNITLIFREGQKHTYTGQIVTEWTTQKMFGEDVPCPLNPVDIEYTDWVWGWDSQTPLDGKAVKTVPRCHLLFTHEASLDPKGELNRSLQGPETAVISKYISRTPLKEGEEVIGEEVQHRIGARGSAAFGPFAPTAGPSLES